MVYWPDDDTYYKGTVVENFDDYKCRILYDDGEEEVLDLREQKYNLEAQ